MKNTENTIESQMVAVDMDSATFARFERLEKDPKYSAALLKLDKRTTARFSFDQARLVGIIMAIVLFSLGVIFSAQMKNFLPVVFGKQVNEANSRLVLQLESKFGDVTTTLLQDTLNLQLEAKKVESVKTEEKK